MRRVSFLLLAGLAMLCLVQSAAAELPQPDFTGNRVLNEDLSDALRPPRPEGPPVGGRRGARRR